MIRLSILDLAPVPADGTAADALRNSVDLARVAERSGYRRYWVAEHHLNAGVAAAAPAVHAALLASATSTIRVGSGAVLMPGTTPLQAAEQFGTIAAVHPGRIDLGLGRSMLWRLLTARPGDGVPPGLLEGPMRRAAELLVFPAEPPTYRAQVTEVLDHLAGRELPAPPATGSDVALWVLGSSAGESAEVAGAFGLPFAASYHVTPAAVLDAVAAYRAAFVPGVLPRPYVLVSADVVVAETEAAARALAAPYGEWVLGIRSGAGALPYVTPAAAAARPWTEQERALVADRVDTQFVGAPDTVVDELAALAARSTADEIMVTTICTDHADRVRSTELLAEQWARAVRAARAS